MARYHYTRENENGVVLYLESEPAEDAMGLMVTESEKSKHDMLRAMRKHIRENGITDFTDFQDWCDENNDCWSLALDSGLSPVIEKYIDGRFY